jgi:hypothetical protein
MPTRSPELTLTPTGAATPAAPVPAAPTASARAAYLEQKRTFTARRGAELHAGRAVPHLTCGEAVALIAWWSPAVLALGQGAGATTDPDAAAWSRCALSARATAARAAPGALYPHRVALWEAVRGLAEALDRRNVAAPTWSDVADRARGVRELVASATAAAAQARGGAADAATSIGVVSDALAGGAAKVSAAAGKGIGEGAVRGALSAAAVPAAVAGVGLLGGLLIWRVARNDERAANPGPRRTTRKRGGR